MFLHCYQLKSHDTQELLDTHLTDDYKIIIQIFKYVLDD